jgi:hypothetical protein
MSSEEQKSTAVLLRPLRQNLELLPSEPIFKDFLLTEYQYMERVMKILAEDLVKRLLVYADLDQPILKREEISLIFSNVDSLYSFHRNMVNLLMNSHFKGLKSADFAKNVKTLIPYFKLYAMYLNNLQAGCNELSNRATIVPNFHSFLETTEEMHQVAIIKVLLAPVYRLPQYLYFFGLLYSKATDKDVKNAWKDVIIELVEILNSIVEKFRDASKKSEVLDVQNQFGNAIDLVSPSRQVVKSGELQRHNPNRKINKTASSFLAVFNDQFVFGTKAKGKFISGKVKEIIPLQNLAFQELPDGAYDNLPHLIQITNTSTNKNYIFSAASQREQSEWLSAFSSAVADFMKNMLGKKEAVKTVKNLNLSEHKDGSTPGINSNRANQSDDESSEQVNYQDINAYELAKNCMWRYKEFLDFFIFLNF